MTEVAISVSHWTTPENWDIPALTLTNPAETSTWVASTFTLAGVSIETPLESMVMVEPAALN